MASKREVDETQLVFDDEKVYTTPSGSWRDVLRFEERSRKTGKVVRIRLQSRSSRRGEYAHRAASRG
jgi:hypothetical protein